MATSSREVTCHSEVTVQAYSARTPEPRPGPVRVISAGLTRSARPVQVGMEQRIIAVRGIMMANVELRLAQPAWSVGRGRRYNGCHSESVTWRAIIEWHWPGHWQVQSWRQAPGRGCSG
eukprot:3602663-Rhodomonas_salina.4